MQHLSHDPEGSWNQSVGRCRVVGTLRIWQAIESRPVGQVRARGRHGLLETERGSFEAVHVGHGLRRGSHLAEPCSPVAEPLRPAVRVGDRCVVPMSGDRQLASGRFVPDSSQVRAQLQYRRTSVRHAAPEDDRDASAPDERLELDLPALGQSVRTASSSSSQPSIQIRTRRPRRRRNSHRRAPARAARSSYERVFLRTLASGRLIMVHLAPPTSEVSVATRSVARRRSLDDVAACTTRAPGIRRPRAGHRVEDLRYGASSRQTKDGGTWLHERSWACARLPKGSTPTCLRSGPRCGGSCSGVRSEPRKRE